MSDAQAQEPMGDPVADLKVALADLLVAYELKHARYVETLGLNRGQLTTLFFLRREREATPATIGGWLQQSSSTTTYVVDQLEAQGFVARRRHPHDRRKLFVTITQAGSDITDLFIETIAAAAEAATAFNPDVAGATAQVLRHFAVEMTTSRPLRS